MYTEFGGHFRAQVGRRNWIQNRDSGMLCLGVRVNERSRGLNLQLMRTQCCEQQERSPPGRLDASLAINPEDRPL